MRATQPHAADQVISRNDAGNITGAFGTTVPTNTTAGYSTGCLFHHTDGTTDTALYVNEGTASSCTFRAVSGLGILGTAAGVRLAHSAAPLALDGSNPTPILAATHGLTTVIAAFAQLAETAAPGDLTTSLAVAISGTTINVYAWAAISGTDPTLVASTGTETFHWLAFGT